MTALVLVPLDPNDPQPRRNDERFGSDYKAFRRADKAWSERERNRRKRLKTEESQNAEPIVEPPIVEPPIVEPPTTPHIASLTATDHDAVPTAPQTAELPAAPLSAADHTMLRRLLRRRPLRQRLLSCSPSDGIAPLKRRRQREQQQSGRSVG